MADTGTNTALIAAITSLSTIMGAMIVSYFNSKNERQRSTIEIEKIKLNKKYRELELRNHAYIKFLSIRAKDGYDIENDKWYELNSELVEKIVALVLTYGSPEITNLLVDAYPFRNLHELDDIKTAIKRELAFEKAESWKPPSKRENIARTEAKTKPWWRIWR
jgi:hypothetical protein